VAHFSALSDGRSGPVLLENIANNSAPPAERRSKRYAMRAFLWRNSSSQRCKHCGRTMTGEVVGVRYSEGKGAGFSGLQTCGSVWICPVCSAKILARRSLETGVMCLAWEREGGRLALGTLTMRHHQGHSLKALWKALATAWGAVTYSKVWRKQLARLGVVGWIKVVEVNVGPNGWHVHIHFALLLGEGTSDADLAALSNWLTPKWQRAVAANGFDALPVGQDLAFFDGVDAAVQLGEYMSKQTAYGSPETLGLELFGGANKRSRSVYSTVPVWRLLEDIMSTGELDEWHRWVEYEKASKGKHQFSVSKGLRERLGVGVEKSDEEIASEEAGDRDLVQITRHGWSRLLRSGVNPAEVLSVMESGGVSGVCRFLEMEGIEHMEVREDA
jgi:hypothetical protein